mmetsp:Transcript_41028/g.96314  ORF Transcript_41028/g.96314 Transcript_41028/m.96314 type:complete len:266 (-) Transcript_41028:453-1250(-)
MFLSSNVTLRNLLYFWVCPSLTYQIAFPRTPSIRWTYAFGLLLRIVAAVTVATVLVLQTIVPPTNHALVQFQEGRLTPLNLLLQLLQLSIPNTYLWLLIFYSYFHLFLNLCAELTRFGDRVFYKDWWNASNVDAYWRLWNLPVHYWLVRHLYMPCMRWGIPKPACGVFVFLFSAIFHEMALSVPLHLGSSWSFWGMMAQIPLAHVTKKLDRKFYGSSLGNVIFWLTFCVLGQPMGMMMYVLDYATYKSTEATNGLTGMIVSTDEL